MKALLGLTLAFAIGLRVQGLWHSLARATGDARCPCSLSQ